jgi:hypothetical protein
MILTEEVLQRAVARYCAEHQEAIRSGQLTEAMLQESILAGVADKFHAAKQAVSSGVERVRNDYEAGAAVGALKELAAKRTDAELDFEDKLDYFRQQVAQIQAQRIALRKEHRAIMRSFHQQQHEQYVRAGQALGIPYVQGDAFYDAVDHALEQRKMVPAVLTESWGSLDEMDSTGSGGSEIPLEEGEWAPGYNPTPEEIAQRAAVAAERARAQHLPSANPRAQVAANQNGAAWHRTLGQDALASGAIHSLTPTPQSQAFMDDQKLNAQNRLAQAQAGRQNPAVAAALTEEEAAELPKPAVCV